MTISAMGKKRVVLGLAICLVLSSFHEVSCQVGGNDDSNLPDDPERPGLSRRSPMTLIEDQNENENENESGSEGGSSVETSSAMSSKETSSSMFQSDESVTIQGDSSSDESGAVSDHEGSPLSNIADDVRRIAKEHLGDLNMGQGGSDGGNKVGESKDPEENDLFTGSNLNVKRVSADENDARRKQLDEIERDIKAAAAQKLDEQKFTKTTRETKSEAASMESRNQFESKKSNSGSRVIGSLGIGQTGMWRCVNQDTNGAREEDDSPIVIPKYNLDDIIKEESTYEGSSSKTSSLIASLTAIVEKHKQGRGSSSVSIGKRTSTEKSETIEKIKVNLKQYRNIKVSELVTRSDFEHILTMASRYEELTSASVSYISRLSRYKSVIKEGTKATKRVQLAHQRATLLNEMANEKQKRVDAELELVKTYAQKGDALYVKIFALKKAMLKLEAEKKEVEMSFQKIVANLSIVIEEAAQAYEEHHVAVRQWREEKTSLEFSYEAIESAESVWVSFLSTL